MRRILAGLAAAVLAVSGLALVQTPAQAAVLDITCTLSSNNVVTFEPPLKSAPASVLVTPKTSYRTCVSLSNPAITYGDSTASVTRNLGCQSLLDTVSYTFTIVWSTGQTSTIAADSTATITAGLLVVTLTGTVTAGVFAGNSVLQTVTGVALPVIACTAGLGTVSALQSPIVTFTLI